MSSFEVLTPNGMEELKKCLKAAGKDTKIISGGTDLMIKIKDNPQLDYKLIDISGIGELDYIKVEDGYVKIGSRTTFTEICENQDVIKYGKCLSQAASQVGSQQIRNWGTIGGNIGNSSPAGDSIPALCSLEAAALIMDGEGDIEEVPVRDVITDIGKNCVGYNRVITEIKFPARDKNYISAFAKIGSRTSVTIAKLNMGLLIEYDRDNNMIGKANVALGALGTTVIYSEFLSSIISGKKVSEKLKEEFLNAVTVQVDMAIPGRASQGYKREAIRGLALNAWDKLFKDIDIPEKEMR